ncbi:hypothetical protein HWV07_04745 [Natronomonas salina]|nr:hypothetical protein [Natronomonas salina]QLD88376.1 hypothetical protein HWV07_04745 [Natronomonas salina]
MSSRGIGSPTGMLVLLGLSFGIVGIWLALDEEQPEYDAESQSGER